MTSRQSNCVTFCGRRYFRQRILHFVVVPLLHIGQHCPSLEGNSLAPQLDAGSDRTEAKQTEENSTQGEPVNPRTEEAPRPRPARDRLPAGLRDVSETHRGAAAGKPCYFIPTRYGKLQPPVNQSLYKQSFGVDCPDRGAAMTKLEKTVVLPDP